jgi:hypothetical protein
MDGLPPAGDLLDAFGKAEDSRQQVAIADALAGAKLDDGATARAIAMLEQQMRRRSPRRRPATLASERSVR